MNGVVCPVTVRESADVACIADCPFQRERSEAAERLRLIKSALLHDREQASEQDQRSLDPKIDALKTMLDSEESVAQSAATTCKLPDRRRRLLGGNALRCSSRVSQDYDKAVSAINYSPVAEALTLIAARPVARTFLEEAAAEAGIMMPDLRPPENDQS